MIQDVWRLTKNNSSYRLMETNLSEKHFNKNAFSRMVVMFVVQLLSHRVANMMRTSLENPSIVTNL